jgi:hypothetical protein
MAGLGRRAGGGGTKVVLRIDGTDELSAALRRSLRVETIRGGSLEFN